MTISRALAGLIGKECIRETVIKRRQNIIIYLLTQNPIFISNLFKEALERYKCRGNQVNGNVARFAILFSASIINPLDLATKVQLCCIILIHSVW